MNIETPIWAMLIVAGVAALGAEAANSLQRDIMPFESLFKLVNGGVILAIMGVTTAIRKMGGASASRWIPAVPLGLGFGAGYLLSEDHFSIKQICVWALLYGGAASIGYLFIWKTVMKKGLDDA